MYEYRFVEVSVNWFNRKPKDDYKRIVAEHAADGWRLVQVCTPSDCGGVTRYELIFEREKPSDTGAIPPPR